MTSDRLAFVGTYCDAEADGIFTVGVDDQGRIERRNAVSGGADPSFLALDSAGDNLYSVNEIDDGTANAFAIDDAGALAQRNRVSVGDDGPCHCSVDASGRCLLTAQYHGGSVSVLPIREDGSLGEATTVVEHSGSGPDPDRQTEPHPHSITPGPRNEYAYVPDLGTDEIVVYDLDPNAPTIEPADCSPVEVHAGAGPRHLSFHPNGRYAYLIDELDSTIVAFEVDPTTGDLATLATVDTLAEPFDGENYTADIHVHPSGDSLYGSNRGHDSIAVYELADDGRPRLLATESTRGEWPRNFAIDPSGEFLYVENADTDEIVTFRIGADGTLDPTGATFEVPSPVCMLFRDA
jgi:6-phosphogluconolactonase